MSSISATQRSAYAVALWLSVAAVSAAPANAALHARLVTDLNTTVVAAGTLFSNSFPAANGEFFSVANRDLWWSDGVETRQLIAGIDSAGFQPFAQLGGRTLFSRWGILMATDGTVEGTVEVTRKAFFSGPPSAVLTPQGANFALFRGDTSGDDQLWRTDGTNAGTRRLTASLRETGRFATRLVEFKGNVYFNASDTRGPALWSSNGTPTGTRVFDRRFEPSSFAATPRFLFAFAQELTRWTLWRTDGTTGGTLQLATMEFPTSSFDSIGAVTTIGDRLYFIGFDAAGFYQLFTSDGTAAGTRKLTSIPRGQIARELETAGSRVAFAAFTAARGSELWTSDGTIAGTRSFNLCPGACGSEPHFEAVLENRLYFTAKNPARGRELWSTDGATARIVNDFCPGPCDGSPNALAILQGHLLVQANDGSNGFEIWRTDGTPQSTARISDIDLDPSIPAVNVDFFQPALKAPTRSPHVFAATDAAHGTELWVTDGTAEGTHFLHEITANLPGDSFATPFFRAGNRLVFQARKESTFSMWGTDGTAEGTREIFPGGPPRPSFGVFRERAEADSFTLFAFDSFDILWDLFRTDGTPEGTFRIPPEGPVLGPRIKLFARGDRAWFVGAEPATGLEIWASDGTIGGSAPEIDFRPGPQGSDVRILGPFANGFLFSADDGSGSRSYVTEGTLGSVQPLDVAYPGVRTAEAMSSSRTLGARTILFRRNETRGGGDLFAIAEGGPLVPLANFDSNTLTDLLFLGEVSNHLIVAVGFSDDREIWSTDGTPTGTRRLFATSRLSRSTAIVADKLYLNLEAPGFPFPILWSTDGATVERVFPSIEDPLASALPVGAISGHLLLYERGDGFYARSPDGALSRLLAVRPNTFDDPPSLISVNDRVFFNWNDGVHGSELWVIESE